MSGDDRGREAVHGRHAGARLRSGAADFGVPGVAEHAFPLKHLDDALALRAHILDRFELADADPGLVAAGGLDVVVVAAERSVSR